MSDQDIIDTITEGTFNRINLGGWGAASEAEIDAYSSFVADVLAVLRSAGYATVKLPEPTSTRYEGDDQEPEDRLAWWQQGSLFGVSQWGYPNQVQLAFEGEPFEPLSVGEARFIASALLAAAAEADQ